MLLDTIPIAGTQKQAEEAHLREPAGAGEDGRALQKQTDKYLTPAPGAGIILLTSSLPNGPIGDNLLYCLRKTCRLFLGNLINANFRFIQFSFREHKG